MLDAVTDHNEAAILWHGSADEIEILESEARRGVSRGFARDFAIDQSAGNPCASFQHHRRASTELELEPDRRYLIICLNDVTFDGGDEKHNYGTCVLIHSGDHHARLRISGCFSTLVLDEDTYAAICRANDEADAAAGTKDRFVFTSRFLSELCEVVFRMESEDHAAFSTTKLIASLGMVGFVEAERQRCARDGQSCSALPKWKLKKVTEYVRSNLADKLSVKTLARLCGYSPYHFSRMFKSSCGTSPKQFIINERVKRACDLLTGSQSPISMIAYDCGFSSQSHMTSAIKTLLGKTPNSIRKDAQILSDTGLLHMAA